MSKWHKGPPPSVGWWPASQFQTDDCYRWWDGRKWSYAVFEIATAEEAAMTAKLPGGCDQSMIQWQHRPESWPARSKT